MEFEQVNNNEFRVKTIECTSCNEFKPLIYPLSHFFYVDRGVPKGVLCEECADSKDKRQIPVGLLRTLIENTQLEIPVKGNFCPVEVVPDQPDSGAYAYWMEIGNLVLEELATWREKVLKFTLGGNRYKGLWIKPHWAESQVIGFSLAGDTPSKKLELDIYQQTRLTQLGFKEVGKTNKTWEISLSKHESGISNVAAIIIHILRYGYLLEPSDLSTITPTLDIDLNDPEWQHLRN